MLRKKIKKIIIRLITGVCLVLYLTTSGIVGVHTVKAQTNDIDFTILYKHENYKRFSPEQQVQLINGLATIGNTYNFKDVKFLQFVTDVEQRFGLEPCELLALLSVENSFTDKTVVEQDGVASYNMSQMRLGTAKIAYNYLTSKGVKVPVPNELKLEYDRYYVVILTGGYLEYLHSKYPSNVQVWTAYNAGEEGMARFKSKNYKYSYTIKMEQRMAEFQGRVQSVYKPQ